MSSMKDAFWIQRRSIALDYLEFSLKINYSLFSPQNVTVAVSKKERERERVRETSVVCM